MAQSIAKTLAGKGVVVQVDTEKNRELARRFGVKGIPAFFALKEGRIVGSLSGARGGDEIVAWFRNAVGQ